MLLFILLLFQNFPLIINCCVFELFYDELKVTKCCTDVVFVKFTYFYSNIKHYKNIKQIYGEAFLTF